MTLALLLLTSFLGAFSLGFIKYLGVEFLSNVVYAPDQKDWIIQVVGALMTFGPVLAYFISSPLAAAKPKRWIMVTSLAMTTTLMVVGQLLGFPGHMWTYLFGVGFLMGIFSVAKMSCVPLEAQARGMSTTKVNAGMSISFILGMLMGLPAGTEAFHYSREMAGWIGIGSLVISGVFSVFCLYPKESRVPYKRAKGDLLHNTVSLLLRNPIHLISSPLLWGTSGALILAVTAYAEIRELGSATECSYMALFAALGAIAGNALSPVFRKARARAAFFSSLIFLVLVVLIPVMVEVGLKQVEPEMIYWGCAGLLVLAGTCFGISTNLIDAELLEIAAAERREGPGAALQSFQVSFFSFVVGGIVGSCLILELTNILTQFVLLTLLSVPATLLFLWLSLGRGELNFILRPSVMAVGRWLLSLRYRVEVEGKEHLEGDNKGVLILPNHPGEIDPVILTCYLEGAYRPRPVVIENFYHMSGVNALMRMVGAFSMPDMEKGSGEWKQRKIQTLMEEVALSLEKGSNVLMYPSGRLMRSGTEKLGAASGAHLLMNRVKDLKVLMVRTRGLWGSRFSTAPYGGNTPDLFGAAKEGAKALLRCGLFFLPRRKVTLSLKPLSIPDANLAVMELNAQLEGFFNALGEEPALVVPDRRGEEAHVLEANVGRSSSRDLSSLSSERLAELKTSLANYLEIESTDLAPEKSLAEDLGMDSIAKAEVLAWLDEEHEMGDVDLQELQTVGDVLAFAGGLVESTSSEEEGGTVPVVHGDRPDPLYPVAENLGAAFLEACDHMGDQVAVEDPTAGTLTWKRFKVAVLMMAREYAEWPEERVGVMLPASAGASICTLALTLAGKTPVMLNWTVGRKNLEHAVEASGLERVLTSDRFLDRIDHIDFGWVEDRLCLLEDLGKKRFGVGEKLSALRMSRKSASELKEHFGLNGVDPASPAVILFTSGSESAPKGVPLSHANLLSNIQGALRTMPFGSQDVLYSFLPPFHSFGFTITMLMPLLSGLKVVFHPNPTESRKIVRGCVRYGVTHLCGTPTFVSGLMRAAGPGQLDSVKVFVTGAEKLPETLRDSVVNLGTGAKILEGYGITECSPVLTLNRLDEDPHGVGRPFKGTELLIVDSESKEALPLGERGLVLAKGPNIFSGYLGGSPNPFVEVQGESWYNTGDLGILNEKGSLMLAGRMKRFVKVAGEMISLPALEQALEKHLPAAEEGPTLAVEALEREGSRPVFWLFSHGEVEVDVVNAHLKSEGFGNLSKISRVSVGALPVLGTGKTDYRQLKAIMKEELKS